MYIANYGTILKTVELRLTKIKNKVDYQKTMNLWFIHQKNFGNILNQLKVLNKYIALIYFRKTMVLWENYGTMKKKYDAILKTMEH